MKQYLFSTLFFAWVALPFSSTEGTSKSEEQWIQDLSSKNSLTRERAVFHFGKKASPNAIFHLAKLLNNPEETLSVKLEVISSLMQIGGEQALEVLSITLKDRANQQTETRALAAAAIGGGDGSRAIYPLLETLEDENALIVQWKILKALGAIGSDRSLDIIDEYTNSYHPPLLRNTASQILAEHIIPSEKDHLPPYNLQTMLKQEF